MISTKHVARLALAAVLIAVGAAGIARATEPGNCGEFKYWKGGKCVDAREPEAKPWVDRMMARPVW
jgi:hypothetical protein